LRGKRGADEAKSAECAVSREEKTDATAVSRWPFLASTFKFICRKRSFPDRFGKILFGSFWQVLGMACDQPWCLSVSISAESSFNSPRSESMLVGVILGAIVKTYLLFWRYTRLLNSIHAKNHDNQTILYIYPSLNDGSREG
jgi:hypothetical protein